MTSYYLRKNEINPKKFIHFRLLSCASLLTLIVGFNSPVNATSEWQRAEVPITGIVSYVREKCVRFEVDEKVEYRFSSKHPVSFDIHYHPGEATLYKIKEENVDSFSGEFISDSGDHYCFTWRNHVHRGENWPISFEYRVLK